MATEVDNNRESDNESEYREPSHNMEGCYAVLAETNNQYGETWYYFIRYDTNVEALEQLYAQLESIEWVYLESYSTFALDLENLVSPQTAKELTKLCINEGSYHRKFDGTLEFIDFGFRKRDNNIVRLINVCDTIGFGNIENFIDGEDFDPEDFETDSESEEETDEESSDDERRGHPESKPVRQSDNKATTKTQQRDSSESNSNKQETKEEREESKPSSKESRKKKTSTDKSTLPTPPVPPPSPAVAPAQQPNTLKKKKN